MSKSHRNRNFAASPENLGLDCPASHSRVPDEAVLGALFVSCRYLYFSKKDMDRQGPPPMKSPEVPAGRKPAGHAATPRTSPRASGLGILSLRNWPVSRR